MPPKGKKTTPKPPKSAADIEAQIEELKEQADALKKTAASPKKLTPKEREAKDKEEAETKARINQEQEAEYLANKGDIDALVTRMGKHLKTTPPHFAHLAILRLLDRRLNYTPKAKRTGGNLS